MGAGWGFRASQSSSGTCMPQAYAHASFPLLIFISSMPQFANLASFEEVPTYTISAKHSDLFHANAGWYLRRSHQHGVWIPGTHCSRGCISGSDIEECFCTRRRLSLSSKSCTTMAAPHVYPPNCGHVNSYRGFSSMPVCCTNAYTCVYLLTFYISQRQSFLKL